MNNLQDVKAGWDFMNRIMVADLSGHRAHSDYSVNKLQNQKIHINNQRFKAINDEIDKLAKSINEHIYRELGEEQLKGYLAEVFIAGTFNIDAIKKGSSHRAYTLQDNGYGSVDISTNFGKNYSVKYSNFADRAEQYQAILNKETRLPKYKGQELLIAPEQVEEAKLWAIKRANINRASRPEIAASHEYARAHLVGVISDGKGVSSKELSAKEAVAIAKEAKEGKFKPENHGIKKKAYLPEVQINYLQQALKAGFTSATITAIMELVPELYKAIDYLIKQGEIDKKQLKESSREVLSKSGDAFLRGAILYGVQMAIEKGLFGAVVTGMDSTIVAITVTLVLDTLKNSILVASGEMSALMMGEQFIDTLIISLGYFASTKIGVAIAGAFFPNIFGMSYALGSLLGCVIATTYNIGKHKLISFCVDSGFTCFGLVEQNYELPEGVLKELGIDTVKINRATVNRAEIKSIVPKEMLRKTQYETVKLTFLRRGIIGVNKIGYAL